MSGALGPEEVIGSLGSGVFTMWALELNLGSLEEEPVLLLLGYLSSFWVFLNTKLIL